MDKEVKKAHTVGIEGRAFNARSSILEVASLTKTFGELVACSKISFDVRRGEIFGIAGPNGAGKTTLFNCIAGMYNYSGNVVFDRTNIDRLRADRVCHIGIARTFQVPLLFNTMTVSQNVKVGAHFGLKAAKNEAESIRETIKFVGLEEKGEHRVDKLKLLDKKLTMLAAALATKPKLLLLDEPMAGLSPSEVQNFIKLVGRMNDELDMTVVVIEHLMKVLTEIADRLMILNNGQRMCVGVPKEVCQDEEVIRIYLGDSHARR